MDSKYGIKIAARLSGLTPYVIRSWEKRYGIVDPERTDTNRRRYSNEDIELLRTLRLLTEAGYSIGSIAGMTFDALKLLLGTIEEQNRGTVSEDELQSHATMREELLQRSKQLDGLGIERLLVEGSVRFSHRTLLEEIIVPFMQDVGRSWKEGSLRIAHEHVASMAVSNVLTNLLFGTAVPTDAPPIVVSTPQGQQHELGALVAANMAVLAGWDATWLGPDLPAEEIAASVRDLGASVVLLSIVYPPDDPHVRRELTDLMNLLPEGTALLIGGHSAAGYSETITRIGATLLRSVADLWDVLNGLRETEQHCFS